jgi:CheY-like chemotaxis protein
VLVGRRCPGLLEGWDPHVLLLDIEMPEEDGYAFLRTIRASGPCMNTPAIALTAYGRSEDRIRALAEGFTVHLSKPVDPTELSQVIADLAARPVESANTVVAVPAAR